MEAGHRLRCLGYPALFAPNGNPIRIRTKKHLALLAYLAVEPRGPHRRDRLAELLWPRASTAEARHSLATALSVLRARLGRQALDGGREHVRLAPSALVLDLDRLAAGDIVGNEVVPPLEVAAFLDGFDIPDAPEFMLWKDRQQARLLPAIKTGLIRLMDLCRRTGDSRQIALLADRMLALDELSEEAIRAKMEACAFVDDRLSALRVFEEWKVKLAEELGAAPSALVEGIAVRLRQRGWERTTASDIPTVRTDQWRGRPFVGRASEYRVLYEAWEQTARAAPVHSLVLGDSGIGKTTLVGRFTTAAGLEGAAISRVQCYEIEREIPYATVGSLIHGLLGQPGVSATAPEALAEIGRTVPEVRQRFPGLPAPVESRGETARIRFTEAVHAMLGTIAEEHPVILVVDDLHLADDASLAVLHLVMRKAKTQPIMVIFTARPGELQQSPHAARLREAGPALALREVELAPLSDEESLEMLQGLVAVTGPRPGATARRALLRAARGYPMVLELLLQDWQAHGDQSLALSVDAMTAELGRPGAPVCAYRQLLERIVHDLDATSHNVLNLAAILGHRLNDLAMYRLVDLTMGQTMAGLNALVRHRVLRDSDEEMEFVNELLRAHAYVQVPSTVRRVLHGGIADRLIEAERNGAAELGLEIAWHCMRAGRPEEASDYLLRGARDASRRGALFEAERGLSTALPHLAEEHRTKAALLLADVLQEQGRWQESLDVLIQHPDAAQCGEGRVLTIVGHEIIDNGRSEGPAVTSDRIHELLELVERGQDLSTRARAATGVAHLVSGLRDRTLAQVALQATHTIVTEKDCPETDRLLVAQAKLLYLSGDTQGSLEHLSRAATRLEATGTANTTLLQLHLGLGTIRCGRGQYAEAEQSLKHAHRVASRLCNDAYRARIAAQIALCVGRQGQYDEQIVWLTCARSVTEFDQRGYIEAHIWWQTAIAHAVQGRTAEVLECLQRLRLSSERPTLPWVRQAQHFFEADILYLVGRRSAAREIARVGTELPEPRLHDRGFAGMYARWLATIADGPAELAIADREIAYLEGNLEALDALDQVEVTCARRIVLRKNGTTNPDVEQRIQDLLTILPRAIQDQLGIVGALD